MSMLSVPPSIPLSVPPSLSPSPQGLVFSSENIQGSDSGPVRNSQVSQQNGGELAENFHVTDGKLRPGAGEKPPQG